MAPCLMINLVTIVMHHHHQHQGVAKLLIMMHDKCSHSSSYHGNDCGNSNSCSHGNNCSMIIKSYYLDYLGTTVSSTLTWPGKSNTGDISKLLINLCVNYMFKWISSCNCHVIVDGVYIYCMWHNYLQMKFLLSFSQSFAFIFVFLPLIHVGRTCS